MYGIDLVLWIAAKIHKFYKYFKSNLAIGFEIAPKFWM